MKQRKPFKVVHRYSPDTGIGTPEGRALFAGILAAELAKKLDARRSAQTEQQTPTDDQRTKFKVLEGGRPPGNRKARTQPQSPGAGKP